MSINKDRIPLPPADARKTLMTCHFCIVGCGYHVYEWDANREGGRAPHENALGLDFRTQLPAQAGGDDPGDAQRDHRPGRPQAQHHGPAGQGLLGQPGAVVHPRRAARVGDVHPRGGRRPPAEASAAVHRRRLDRHHVGARPRDLRRAGEAHPRRARTRPAHVQLLRPRGRGRRLREHLGHRQAHVLRLPDQDGPHPQPPRLQLRVPCLAGHGGRRAQQLLRGRGSRRHHRRRRHQRLRDADQLLPRTLDPEPDRGERGQEEAVVPRRSRPNARS